MANDFTEKEVYLSEEPDFFEWIKKIIKILFSYKKFIIIMTTISLLIGIAYSFLIIKTYYTSKTDYLIRFPEKVVTSYGEFIFPSRNLSEYNQIDQKITATEITLIDLENKYTKDQLEKMLSVNIDATTSRLSISVKSEDSAEAYRIAQIYAKNYISVVGFVLDRIAVDSLLVAKKLETSLYEKSFADSSLELADAKKILESIPKTIILEKSFLDDFESSFYFSGKTEEELKKYKKNIVLSQEINPEYANITALISTISLDTKKIETQLTISKQDLGKLEEIKAMVDNILISKNLNDAKNVEGLNLMQSVISVLNYSQLDNVGEHQSRFKIISLFLIIGLFFSIFISLVSANLSKIKNIFSNDN